MAAFLLGCIPSRVGLAYLAHKFPTSRWLGVLFALIGIGFWAIFVFGWRTTGLETGGASIWWNALRPVHGTLYLYAAYMVLMHATSPSTWPEAWVAVAADAAIGLTAFVWFHGIASRNASLLDKRSK